MVLERDHRSQQPHMGNVTAQELAPGATLTVFDAAGLWTHSLLGAEDATDFSCSEDCQRNESTTLDEQDGDAVYRGLAVTEPVPAPTERLWLKARNKQRRWPPRS